MKARQRNRCRYPGLRSVCLKKKLRSVEDETKFKKHNSAKIFELCIEQEDRLRRSLLQAQKKKKMTRKRTVSWHQVVSS